MSSRVSNLVEDFAVEFVSFLIFIVDFRIFLVIVIIGVARKGDSSSFEQIFQLDGVNSSMKYFAFLRIILDMFVLMKDFLHQLVTFSIF